jgi:hypothetical protein
MSFSPPFKDVFEPGDLVYGDQYDRRFFLYSGIVDPIHYKKEFDLIKLTDQKPFTTFDERTQPGRMKGLPSIIDDLNNYLADMTNSNLTYISKGLASRFNKYLHESSYNKDKINKPSSIFDWEYQKIKDQCKAGLDFQIRGTGLDGKGGGVIHFALGPILLHLMEYVVGKSNPVLDKTIRHYFFGENSGLFVTEKKRHITGAEIRWVYRNRKDPKVQSKIQFWRVNPKYEKLYSIETLKAQKKEVKIEVVIQKAVGAHVKAQKENIALKKSITHIFEPCYPPWTPEFSLITAALWEQYKPKSEHDDPGVFIRVLDPGTKNTRRKVTIDNRKF